MIGRQEPPPADDAVAWITGIMPHGLFTAPPLAEGATEADTAAAEAGRISGFREETRDQRIRIARQIEHRYRRKMAWGVDCGGTRQLFTTYSAPVMTRLRQPERQV